MLDEPGDSMRVHKLHALETLHLWHGGTGNVGISGHGLERNYLEKNYMDCFGSCKRLASAQFSIVL